MSADELIDIAFARLQDLPQSKGRALPYTEQEICDWMGTLSDEDFVKMVVFSAYKQVQEGQRSYAS